jgi:hypothetical protein
MRVLCDRGRWDESQHSQDPRKKHDKEALGQATIDAPETPSIHVK